MFLSIFVIKYSIKFTNIFNEPLESLDLFTPRYRMLFMALQHQSHPTIKWHNRERHHHSLNKLRDYT